jgi:hypothetical protein
LHFLVTEGGVDEAGSFQRIGSLPAWSKGEIQRLEREFAASPEKQILIGFKHWAEYV